MVLYLVDVPTTLDESVRQLVANGRYKTTAHATEAALDLLVQLHAMSPEQQRTMLSGPNGGETALEVQPVPLAASTNLLGVPRYAPPSRPSQLPPDDRLLWAVPRLFPMKLAARVLSNMLIQDGTDSVPMAKWTTALRPLALEQARRLSALDTSSGRKFGEHFAAGLPANDAKDPAASWARFVVQYLFGPKRNGGAEGAMARLGLIRIDDPTSSEPNIGLTPTGVQLALAANPVLDQKGDIETLLSADEREIFFRALQEHPERGHMRQFLTALLGGARNPRDVLPSLATYYETAVSSQHMSEGYASSLRGGVVGRLRELGAIEVERDGNQLSYTITTVGRTYLKMLEA